MDRRADPWPLLELALRPLPGDGERLRIFLDTLVAENPGLRVSTDPECGQVVLAGPADLELDVFLRRAALEREVAVDIGAPQVAYRESLGRKAEIDYTHKKQTGGTGQFARVKIVFEPGEPGSGFVFESKIVGGNVPKEYIPGVEKGIANSKDNGLLAGFPLIDFKASLIDGAYHDVDSSVLAFEIASRAAFKELREKGNPKLLEPIMKVETVAPVECGRVAVADLHGRRGEILGQELRGKEVVVTALAPLANMFGYPNKLHQFTNRRGRFAMAFDHYAPVPLPETPDGPFAPAAALRA